MKKGIYILAVFLVVFGLCACGKSENKVLSQYEAINILVDAAEPKLAEAIGVPAYLFEMDDCRIRSVVHDEDVGKWYFEIYGSIPMYDEGLWWITYSFDATVDDVSGAVTLGGLSLDYGYH